MTPNPYDGGPGDGAPDPTSPAKELTSLVFLASNNPGLAADVTAAIDGTTVKATVPFGRNRSLVATFATTGARVEVAGMPQQSGVTSNAFLAPVVYRVVAGDGSTLDYTVTAAEPLQRAYIKASNTDEYDYFGGSVALSADGNTLVVGVNAEASATTGINGNQRDNSADASGAVYVFIRSGATWSQQAYIKASNAEADDNFGFSVALSADSNTLAVGAYREASAAEGIGGNQRDHSASQSGAVYVFARSGTTWSQQAYIKASNANARDDFGFSVALSADGVTLAVASPGEASAATGIGGNQSDNASLSSGAVYVFARSGTAWSQQAYVKASNTGAHDDFGCGVVLSADGVTLAAASPGEDSAGIGVNDNSKQRDNSKLNSGAV